ncbi:MAG: bifunctional pyr operon transcriptional regulator/uracil phosphoribosyltransferase PyrR, partial [Deltaproteobacteria bacterium]|nr:bifunctional pyr operon transcriptional regulator/uracil phosphoribosyltransferase PyrR [Deltaproteobacteria bacterium]
VIRHYWDGAVQAMAEFAHVPVVNAGDGSHEHPTQTLCDLYTLKKEKGDLKGLTVVICGDLKHGRTIHSLVYALARFGVHVVTLAANGMELPEYVIEKLQDEHHYSPLPLVSRDLQAVVEQPDAVYLTPDRPHQLALFTKVDEELQDDLSKLAPGLKFDAFYVTRKQKERLREPAAQEKESYPTIGTRFLKEKRFKDSVVMHPLPRVDELSRAVDKDRRGIYFKQAAYGVPVRMALLTFLLNVSASSRPGKAHPAFYRGPEGALALCANPNCVTQTETASTQPRFEALFPGSGETLNLRCFYCDHPFKARFVGHIRSKRYCPYDIGLKETVEAWLRDGDLIVFDSIKQAEELGYEPYRIGPQRNLMDEAELRAVLKRMSEMIGRETEERERLVILGIRTKGAFLGRRIARELEKQWQRKIETGEIEMYGSGGQPKMVLASDPALPRPELHEREVILVDDVIHTGRTVRAALSLIFQAARPRSVRLAVLIDRGHREVPVKPDYVGKHIPSSERERVRVKLREVEQDERDKVVVYSIINADDSNQRSALSSNPKADS